MQNDIEDIMGEAIFNLKGDKLSSTSPTFYTSPDNWRLSKGVILIHEETETVLGNFEEWIHIKEAGTRKLVASSSLIVAYSIERVSGDWWISPKQEIASPESWYEKRTLILPLCLSKLSVQSPLVEVSVHLSHGAIARVELVENTMFAQINENAEQLLYLPKGANILPVMGQDSKIALRIELGKEEI